MARGESGRLSTAQLLDIELSSICSRNQYTNDAAPVVDELQRAAGNRTDILAQVAGTWAGYFDSPETHVLVEALVEIPGAEEWVALGTKRRGVPQIGRHSLCRPSRPPPPSSSWSSCSPSS
ncbi:hypothetical protein [Microbacterium sp. CPCC 204701]|uniref:hypothetical protein n=1 Tax=Microbacterium sp. CPCC 204701 TaxID=2493084 RepID=UPI000FD772EE|nr:hypothetical protein [Microbacterium sp. CPCC 204701]